MTLTYLPEHEELRKSVRALLGSQGSLEKTRAVLASGEAFDRGLWRTMAEQLGLQGLAISEEHGGSGYGLMELGVALEEMGRVVHCSPFYSTVVLAATVLDASNNEVEKAAWLPRIAAGEVCATVALVEQDGDWDAATVTATAEVDGSTARITGTKSFVTDATGADLIIVLAESPSGRVLAAVDPTQAAVTVHSVPSFDETRPLGTVTLDSATGAVLAIGQEADAVLARVREAAITALAAEQVGGAGRSLEMAVEYAKVREQFGRPIGSFQAIKFKAADMLLQLEAARSAALYALRAVSEGHDDRAVAAAVAKSVCSEAYFAVAAESIQIHGGIGFTWEHDAHYYFKRAKTSELLWGNADLHRTRLADLLGW